MIENPIISKNVEKYYYITPHEYLKNKASVIYAKIINKQFIDDEFVYEYETEEEKTGTVFAYQIFENKIEAEKYSKNIFNNKINKIKEQIKDSKMLLDFALNKNKVKGYFTDDEINYAILEKAKEFNII